MTDMMYVSFVNRFPSYDHLMAFWGLIEPSIYKMVRVSRAKSAARRNEEVATPARPSTVGYGLSVLCSKSQGWDAIALTEGYTKLLRPL